jgi:FkbM family methyltransferase
MLLPAFSGRDAETVLDIGANEGFYTLKVKQNNPSCRVLSVEPNPLSFRLLSKNIGSNGLRRISLLNAAITGRNGSIRLEIVPEVTSIGSKDIGLQDRQWLDSRRIKRVQARSMTLPSLCRKHDVGVIDILKIDVEGAEMDILRNGRSVLQRTRRVVVEWHTPQLRDEVKRFMRREGFPIVFEEKKSCGDLYFVRD